MNEKPSLRRGDPTRRSIGRREMAIESKGELKDQKGSTGGAMVDEGSIQATRCVF
jgi:hypothetical protein